MWFVHHDLSLMSRILSLHQITLYLGLLHTFLSRVSKKLCNKDGKDTILMFSPYIKI